MNRLARLLETPAVALLEHDHPAGATHCDPDHEVSRHDSISFVEAGTFDAHVDDEHWCLEPGTLFVTRRGMTYSCRHEDEVPSDRCLVVAYTDAAVEDLMCVDLSALRPPLARTSARREYLRHRLRSCVAGEEVRFDPQLRQLR